MLFLQQTIGRNETKQNKTKKPRLWNAAPLPHTHLRTSMYFLNLFFISVVLRRTGVIKHRWRGADNDAMRAEDIAPRCTLSEILEDLRMQSRIFLFPLWVFPLLPSSCSWNYLFVSSPVAAAMWPLDHLLLLGTLLLRLGHWGTVMPWA